MQSDARERETTVSFDVPFSREPKPKNETRCFSSSDANMNSSTDASNFTSHDHLVRLFSRSEEFILPCLLFIGSTCNALTFLVMRRGRMRYSSSCFYMATLAIADTFVLWIGCLNRWLELLDKQRPILACNACCKLGTFAFFLSADCRLGARRASMRLEPIHRSPL